MRFASALSEHPIPSAAAGEVIGQILERLGEGDPPDLVVLFATAAHTGAIDDISNAVRQVLAPATMLGTTAVSVVGGAREVEEQPALALWAARLGERVTPVRLTAQMTPDGWLIAGIPPGAPSDATMIVLSDPFTFPADAFVDELPARHPGLQVIGGMASAARGPGGNRLILDGSVLSDGAVGALLPASAHVATVVSQGCRPVGDPMIVTKAERNVIFEMAGKPALDQLLSLAAGSDPEERALLQGGLHMGIVIDESKPEFGRGDFLVRNVLGADRDVGAIAIGDEIEVGATVQFHVRDAASADEDLRQLLAGRHAGGALVFTCNGRGTHLFGRPDHDAELVAETVTGDASAGMFCAGELGPVGGRSFLHGFTASILFFDSESDSDSEGDPPSLRQ